eukprot:g2247.t1
MSAEDGKDDHAPKRRSSAFGTIHYESLDGAFLSEETKRLNKVQETLAAFDDGDGTIDADEMHRALRAMGFVSLRGAFETMFGVGKDDTFPVRDRIRMWETTKAMMKDTFQNLLHNRQYEACKVLKARMDEFDEDLEVMHQEDLERHKRFEEKQFDKAARIVRKEADARYEKSMRKVRRYAESKVTQLGEVQGRSQEELEIRIGRFPDPGRLASKQMLEYRSQEKHLAVRSAFDDACVMRKAVDVLERPERIRFDREFEGRLNTLRTNLTTTQSREREQLRQTLVNEEMRAIRHYDRDVKARNERAIEFVRREMEHAHKLDSTTQAQKTFRPLIKKRANHKLTSSSNGGSNFLRKTIGGGSSGQVPVVALTPLHDFEELPQDTVTLR